MTDKTPLESAFVDAEKARRAAEALEAKAAAATDPQWRLCFQKQAELQRGLETYNLDQARDYAALFLDAEASK